MSRTYKYASHCMEDTIKIEFTRCQSQDLISTNSLPGYFKVLVNNYCSPMQDSKPGKCINIHIIITAIRKPVFSKLKNTFLIYHIKSV